MQNFEKFTEEYLEVADNELTVVINFGKDLLWLIISLFLVVVSLPLWLVGKLKRHLTPRAVDEGDSACNGAESTPEHLPIEGADTTPALRN